MTAGARMRWEETQRELWGRRPEDWSELAEPQNTRLFADALDAAEVTAGTDVLDIGCGSGLALSAPGALEGALGEAGFTVTVDREPPGDWRYEDLEHALRGLLGSAGGARAIALAGERRVRAAVTEGLAPFRSDAGAYVMHNHFRLLVAERAA